MKKLFLAVTLALGTMCGAMAQSEYVPTDANIASREAFRDMKLGIFIHWGIYSTFAQGEWYL